MTSSACEVSYSRELSEDFGLTFVKAEHLDWQSTFMLDPASERVVLQFNNLQGAFRLEGERLSITWDNSTTDLFLWKDGCYQHSDLLKSKDAQSPFVFAAIPNSKYRAVLRKAGSDIAVYQQVFGLGEYNTRHLPEQVSVIVDLGANVGLASLFFATRYPNAHIIAVEPDPGNFALLAQNLTQIKHMALSLQAAIWSEDRDLQIKTKDDLGNPLHDWGIQVFASEDGQANATKGWSMKKILQEFDLKKIDILKIDIEGAEKELFEADDMAWLDAVDMILIETHDRFRPGSHAATMKILNHGFTKLSNCGENIVFRRTPPAPVASTFGLIPCLNYAGSLPRVAMITAYYKEEPRFLDHCIKSVRAQTIPTDHILVADGFPQDWIDVRDVRHIRLDQKHSDYGDTPRGLGLLIAIAEQYDAIGFLDADNYLEPNHVESAFKAASLVPDCDFVIAQRHLRRPDLSILPVNDEPIEEHIDTNCYLFLPGSYHAAMDFALVPRQISIIGDRFFYSKLKNQDLKASVIPLKTVNYRCLWEPIYRACGEPLPPDAKPAVDQKPVEDWLKALTPRGREILKRRTHFDVEKLMRLNQ